MVSSNYHVLGFRNKDLRAKLEGFPKTAKIIKGELNPGLDLSDLGKSFNIEELVDSVNTEIFSIFKFHHLEHQDPKVSFLIIEKDNVEIYDILSFDVLIEKILDVSSLDERSKTLCVKEILKIVRAYFEVVDMGRLVIKKDFGKYHYFIPIKNLKNNEGVIQFQN